MNQKERKKAIHYASKTFFLSHSTFCFLELITTNKIKNLSGNSSVFTFEERIKIKKIIIGEKKKIFFFWQFYFSYALKGPCCFFWMKNKEKVVKKVLKKKNSKSGRGERGKEKKTKKKKKKEKKEKKEKSRAKADYLWGKKSIYRGKLEIQKVNKEKVFFDFFISFLKSKKFFFGFEKKFTLSSRSAFSEFF